LGDNWENVLRTKTTKEAIDLEKKLLISLIDREIESDLLKKCQNVVLGEIKDYWKNSQIKQKKKEEVLGTD
jgi:hypothetical protein